MGAIPVFYVCRLRGYGRDAMPSYCVAAWEVCQNSLILKKITKP